MDYLYLVKVEDHIKEGNMKKLFICFALMFSFSFPLGSASTYEDKLMWDKLGSHPVAIKNVVTIPNYSSLNIVLENRAKQVECLAKNIYFEARNEPFAGQFAVALVTLNRVYDDTFPNTVCKVVYQGIHTKNGFPKRDRCQFSWYCDGKLDIPSMGKMWGQSREVAVYVLKNTQLLDITDGATHYHADYIDSPRWASAKDRTMQIDTHIFYNKHKKRHL